MPAEAKERRFFATPTSFRRWLERHHQVRDELWVGFWKKHTGKASITWPESVDEALCFGWIDGLRRRIDDERYMIRFTPRRPDSNWSAVNIERMQALLAADRVAPAGREAFARRSGDRSRTYSYEQRDAARFDADFEKRFRRQKGAWSYFRAQAPWYRKTATFWVMSAKRAQTRQRRLDQLITSSAAGEPIPQLDRRRGGR